RFYLLRSDLYRPPGANGRANSRGNRFYVFGKLASYMIHLAFREISLKRIQSNGDDFFRWHTPVKFLLAIFVLMCFYLGLHLLDGIVIKRWSFSVFPAYGIYAFQYHRQGGD